MANPNVDLNLFPMPITLYHNAGSNTEHHYLNRRTTTYRYTSQPATLVPSPDGIDGQAPIQHTLQCQYCHKDVALDLRETTYGVLSHAILSEPGNKHVLNKLWAHIFFRSALLWGFALVVPWWLVYIIGYGFGPHHPGTLRSFARIWLTLPVLALAAQSAFVRWQVRTRSVILPLLKGQARFNTLIMNVPGVALYRCITSVKCAGWGHSVSLVGRPYLASGSKLYTELGQSQIVRANFARYAFGIDRLTRLRHSIPGAYLPEFWTGL